MKQNYITRTFFITKLHVVKTTLIGEEVTSEEASIVVPFAMDGEEANKFLIDMRVESAKNGIFRNYVLKNEPEVGKVKRRMTVDDFIKYSEEVPVNTEQQ